MKKKNDALYHLVPLQFVPFDRYPYLDLNSKAVFSVFKLDFSRVFNFYSFSGSIDYDTKDEPFPHLKKDRVEQGFLSKNSG